MRKVVGELSGLAERYAWDVGIRIYVEFYGFSLIFSSIWVLVKLGSVESVSCQAMK